MEYAEAGLKLSPIAELFARHNYFIPTARCPTVVIRNVRDVTDFGSFPSGVITFAGVSRLLGSGLSFAEVMETASKLLEIGMLINGESVDGAARLSKLERRLFSDDLTGEPPYLEFLSVYHLYIAQ